MASRRLAFALALSIAGHGALVANRPLAAHARALHERYEHYRIRHERQSLVERARQQLQEGKLRLGEFILEANHLDARAAGKPFDLTKAKEAYADQLKKVKAGVAGGNQIYDAIAQVLQDLEYHYSGDEPMARVLLEQGGACEAIAHDGAALVYDAGYGKYAYLRWYGPDSRKMDDVGHLVPVVRFQSGEQIDEVDVTQGTDDKMGATSENEYRKGTLLPAASLIEYYAIRHGIHSPTLGPASPTTIPASSVPASSPAGKGRAGGFAYPPNSDGYMGTAPLFAHRNRKDSEAFSDEQRPGYNVFLMPPSATDYQYKAFGDVGIPVAVFRKPDPAELTRVFAEIEALKVIDRAEPGNSLFRAAKLVDFGNRVGLYRKGEMGLRLLGKHRLADEAAKRAQETQVAGLAYLKSLDAKTLAELPDSLTHLWNGWTVIFLGPFGDNLLTLSIGTQIVETGLNVHTLARLLPSNPEYPNILQAISSEPKLDQVRIAFIFANQSIELDGSINEFTRFYHAFLSIRPRFTSDSAVPSFDELLGFIKQEKIRNQLKEDWTPYLVFAVAYECKASANDDEPRDGEKQFLETSLRWLGQTHAPGMARGLNWMRSANRRPALAVQQLE